MIQNKNLIRASVVLHKKDKAQIQKIASNEGVSFSQKLRAMIKKELLLINKK